MKYQKELVVFKKEKLNPACFLLELKSEEPLCEILRKYIGKRRC